MVQKRRHFAKALTWRISASVITAIIAYLIVGSYTIALAILAIDSAIKIAWYYLHERLWYKTSWGIK